MRGKLDIYWISIDRIFLDVENPRFPENAAETEDDVVKLLCEHENVLELARDIVVQDSINPLQLLGVILDYHSSGDSKQHTYIAVEGNRRLCALKLLIDPERAPVNYKKTFNALSKDWHPISEVPVTIFDNRDKSRSWVERTHAGLQGGIGRKDWTAEQKQRFSTGTKNKRAQEILDYAQTKGMISEKERKNKLTIVERYLSTKLMKNAIGIDDTNTGDVLRDRPEEDFDKRLRKFIRDLANGEKVNSRSGNTKTAREYYARELAKSIKVSDKRVDSVPLTISSQSTARKNVDNRQPKTVPRARKIRHNAEIQDLLNEIGIYKLESLYYSICKVNLDDHNVPLLTIGSWAFLESLSAAAGRKDGTSFASFYSKSRFKELGFGNSKNEMRPISTALEHLQDGGNATKHHVVAAQVNGPQLANDMQCLEPLILATCKRILNSTDKLAGPS